MKLVCIDNSLRNSLSCFLTIGKTYETTTDPNHMKHIGCGIVNDRGCLHYYAIDRFIPLSEFRQKKLDEIGIV